MTDRLRDLPSDIAEGVVERMSGHRSPQSPVFTEADLDDWRQEVDGAEISYSRRLEEIGDVLDLGSHPDIVSIMKEPDARKWTSLELDLAYEIRDALADGLIVKDGDGFKASGEGVVALEAQGKRVATAAA